MKTGPRPKRRSWTPEEDEQLLALVAAKMDTASIARKLQRTESATDTRKSKLKGEEVTVPKSGRVASFSKNDRRLAQQRLDRTTRWRERYMLSPHR
jgi:hypothetical protein